jgi:hypothetical protein
MWCVHDAGVSVEDRLVRGWKSPSIWAYWCYAD